MICFTVALSDQTLQLQVYNSTVTQMSACLLSLSVMSLLLPVWIIVTVVKSLTNIGFRLPFMLPSPIVQRRIKLCFKSVGEPALWVTDISLFQEFC